MPTTPYPSEAITVWLVEDDKLFRETIQELLDDAPGITCEFAFSSCEDALAKLEQSFAPEVMLMDIGLPGMSGIEGIQRVKTISPATHLIMLTVHEDNSKIFEAICAGASGYLLKPSSAQRIFEAIQSTRHGGAPINPQIANKILNMFTQLAVPQGNYDLTKREHETLQLMVEGLTKKQIAEKLFLSYHTIDMHIRNTYTKLQVHSRSGAVVKALKERLV